MILRKQNNFIGTNKKFRKAPNHAKAMVDHLTIQRATSGLTVATVPLLKKIATKKVR